MPEKSKQSNRNKEKEIKPLDGMICILCGSPMLEHHCKLICPNCGYRMDCSDH